MFCIFKLWIAITGLDSLQAEPSRKTCRRSGWGLLFYLPVLFFCLIGFSAWPFGWQMTSKHWIWCHWAIVRPLIRCCLACFVRFCLPFVHSSCSQASSYPSRVYFPSVHFSSELPRCVILQSTDWFTAISFCKVLRLWNLPFMLQICLCNENVCSHLVVVNRMKCRYVQRTWLVSANGYLWRRYDIR